MNELFISPRGNYVYVEIGALDGILYSNTLHLHTCLGWRGVLMEGNRANYEQLVINVQRTRPEAEVHWGAVCAKAQGFVNFTESGGAVAGDLNLMAPRFKKTWGARHGPRVVRTPCRPMPSYLEKYSRIHFFSLDVEGAEWQVISTLDFGSSAQTKIDVFMIELDGLKENRERIRARLFEAGYIECLLLVVGSGVFVHRNATNTKPCAVPSIAVTGEPAAIWGGRAHLPKPKPPCPPACPSDEHTGQGA